jgi:SAM-dependent methyltransferase
VTALKPPLPYKNATFDAIYAISLLIHLPEDLQDARLKELLRVVKIDGVLLLSVHSDAANGMLPKEDQVHLAENGFLYKRGFNLAPKIFGSAHQNSYQTWEYIGALGRKSSHHWPCSYGTIGSCRLAASQIA